MSNSCLRSASVSRGVRGNCIAPRDLRVCAACRAAMGLVIFAHGGGSDFPRNDEVAAGLRERGLATLLLDLLRPEEEARADRFDIEPLASRLAAAADWAKAQPQLKELPIGYFGAST